MRARRSWRNGRDEVLAQGIPFSDLRVPTSINQLPTADFYSAFYDELFRRYDNFEALPGEWRKNKTQTAKAISGKIPRNSRVLSFGCGLGYVEHQLLGMRADIKLDVFDSAANASKWLSEKHSDATFHRKDSSLGKYDVIYAQQVFYALPKSGLMDVLNIFARSLNEGGVMILINTSSKSIENKSDGAEEKQSAVKLVKDFIRPFYFFVLINIKRKGIQFWGWQRDNDCYINYCIEAGFSLIEMARAVNQSFLTFHLR